MSNGALSFIIMPCVLGKSNRKTMVMTYNTLFYKDSINDNPYAFQNTTLIHFSTRALFCSKSKPISISIVKFVAA